MTKMRISITGAGMLLAVMLAGCGTGINPGTQAVTGPGAMKTVTGRVHGGQQPVSGATIQLYAVGITGLQSTSTPLISQTVQTDGNGDFNITGDWNCTSNTATYGVNPQLYLVATGGNPGLAAGTNNAALALMIALGPCNNLTPSTSIWVNEITTAAAVYTLAPFMADFAHVGAPGAGIGGLVNAFQVAGALANSTTGAVPGTSLPANASVPLAEINTLADLTAVCINSTGTDSACQGFFAAATEAGGAAPANTIAALLNIARNPAVNVTALFNMVPPTAPFQPTLTTAPTDWTLALRFTGGGLNAPTGIALDASGNAWVANAGGNSITELSNTGVLLTGATGYAGNNTIFGPQGIAIDRSGNVWVADTLLSSVVKLTVSGGSVQSSASYSGATINGPMGIAIDSQNNVWVSNFAGASVTELNSAGVPVGASPLTAAGTLQNPSGLAIDSGGNVWTADNSAGIMAEFNNNQTLLSGAGYSDGAIFAPLGVALDGSGRAWVADNGDNAISLFAANGTPSPASPITGSAFNGPSAVAIDGAGTGWVANDVTAGSVSPFAAGTFTSMAAVIALGALNSPAAVTIDASGNIWTANSGDNSVSEFVGLGSPVVTPLALRAGP